MIPPPLSPAGLASKFLHRRSVDTVTALQEVCAAVCQISMPDGRLLFRAVAEQAKSAERNESDAGAEEVGITEEMLYWLGNGMVASDSGTQVPESSFRLSEDSSQFLDPDGSVLVLQPADRLHILEATLPGDNSFD